MAETAAVSILDSYVKTAPSLQNAIDIFKGEWASKLPVPYDQLTAGKALLFQDNRLNWALEQLGGVLGQNVLELGPLEAGHTYILERGGAASITAIEANQRAYLKCLVIKEIVNLSRTRFWCGDFVEYLESTRQQFDLIVASGVLYHMKDPIRLIELISQHTSRTYLWTHYFDQQIIDSKPNLQKKFGTSSEKAVGSLSITQYQQEYQDSLALAGFCGGSAEYSIWLSRQGLLDVFKAFGFNRLEFAFEMPDHPHGPSLSLIAVK